MASFASLPLELVERVASHLAPAALLALAGTSRACRAALHPGGHRASGVRLLRCALRCWGPARALLLISSGRCVQDPAACVPRVLRELEARMARCAERALEGVDTVPAAREPYLPQSFIGDTLATLDIMIEEDLGLGERSTAVYRRSLYFVLEDPDGQDALARCLLQVCRRGDDAFLEKLLAAEIVCAAAFFTDAYGPMRVALAHGHSRVAARLLPVYVSRPALAGSTLSYYATNSQHNTHIQHTLNAVSMLFPGYEYAAKALNRLFKETSNTTSEETSHAALTFWSHISMSLTDTHMRGTDDPQLSLLEKCGLHFHGYTVPETRAPTIHARSACLNSLTSWPARLIPYVASFSHAHDLDFSEWVFNNFSGVAKKAVCDNNVPALFYLLENTLPGGIRAPHGPMVPDAREIARELLARDSGLTPEQRRSAAGRYVQSLLRPGRGAKRARDA